MQHRLRTLPPLFILALILCCQAPSAPLAADGPLEALALAQRGIDESNSDLFTRAVDVNSVTTAASDTLLAALQAEAADGTLGDANIVMALALLGSSGDSSQAGLLKQLLVSEVKGFVATGINGGYFAGAPNGTVKPPKASLASTLEKMPQGRREIIPGKVLSHAGDEAAVSAVFVDPKAGRFDLELGMRRENGNWRVKEISNAAELFKEARKR